MTPCMLGVMTEASGPKPPTNIAVRLPPDLAALLHRLAYETGRSKKDLVIDALRQTYEKAPDATENQPGA